MRTIATFAAIVAIAPAPAVAQGSTGGTLGKSDQSLSGEAKPGAADAPSRAPASDSETKKTKGAASDKQQTGCARIAGSWLWSNGLSVVVNAKGTASATDGGRAVLTCEGGVYLFKWQLIGNETRMTLSADGKRLSGTGIVGPESAVRQ